LCLEAKLAIHHERVDAPHTEIITDVRNFSILPLLSRAGDFCGYDRPLDMSHGVSYEERVRTDGLKLLVLKIGRIALLEHTLNTGLINLFDEQQRLDGRFVLSPLVERVILVGAWAHFVQDLRRHLNVARLALVNEPFPEFWNLIEGIVAIFRGDNNVGIQEVKHRRKAPLTRAQGVTKRERKPV
jgi:hypothetical protein